MNTISVIIPTYNEETRIGQALARLTALKAELPYALQVIVVDGGSRDRTREIATGTGTQLLIAPIGRGAQLHAGALAAAGELLVFLHADTLVGADYFRQAAAAVTAGHGWGCARLRFADEKGRPEGGIFPVMAWFANLRVRRSAIAFGDQSIFCTRAFYNRHGGYDPALRFFEDYRFSEQARTLERPALIRAISRTSSHRHRQQGVVRTLWWMQAARCKYRAGMPIDKLWEYYNR